jgi:demethylmenaquinone methyltransferase/2-methoxy-6-polyprenyl-1,4-benzoquinol methylase
MEHDHNTDYTDFGFKSVKSKLKTGLVSDLFSRVSNQYDVMNDVMSFGLHRCWKKSFIEKLALKPNMKILDVAGGTGDIAIRIAKDKAYLAPQVTVCDLTYDMVCQGKDKAINAGVLGIRWHIGNAEKLPYADASFDRVTIAFGLRNVTNKDAALNEMARVLKPGGTLSCLEFSPPNGPLKPLYDLYSFKIIHKYFLTFKNFHNHS